jgi:hypothetical protein
MSILNNLLLNMEDRLPKVIDAEGHAYLDYARAALLLAAGALFWRRNRRAAVAALAAGGLALTQSLLTDYKLGAVPVLSFKTHGKIDGAVIPALLAAPQYLGFAETPEAWLFRADAVAEAFVVGMTDYGSQVPSDVLPTV